MDRKVGIFKTIKLSIIEFLCIAFYAQKKDCTARMQSFIQYYSIGWCQQLLE